jgi:hypothetical protein
VAFVSFVFAGFTSFEVPSYPAHNTCRMAAKPGFLTYLAKAFNARPFGMFVAPNWVGLAAFGLLGVANPGFWVLGAGLELGYLLTLATNSRFQRVVEAQQLAGVSGEWDRRIAQQLARLSDRDRRRYLDFAERCRSILDLQRHAAPSVDHGLQAQADSLGRLSWMYLRLLLARHVIEHVIGTGESEAAGDLGERLANLERRAADTRLDEELRRSLSGQIDILRQRLDRRAEAERKLAYIEAELARMEQQAELIREQAALSTDPELLSRRIDEIAATLGGTSQWIRDQQQVYGAMEDLLSDAPPVPAGAGAKAHHEEREEG